jgi:hypothetical protein
MAIEEPRGRPLGMRFLLHSERRTSLEAGSPLVKTLDFRNGQIYNNFQYI